MRMVNLADVKDMSAKDAAECASGFGDIPVRITTYGIERKWNSRSVAMVWFKYAAMMCDGSEAERYRIIADRLEYGETVVSDSWDRK